MTKDQYTRAREIEIELDRVREYIDSIEPLRQAKRVVIQVRSVGSSRDIYVYPSNNTAKAFVETVYHEYLDRKKALEEEFESL